MTLARLVAWRGRSRLLFLTLSRSPATRLFPASSPPFLTGPIPPLGFPLPPTTRRGLARFAAIATASTLRLEKNATAFQQTAAPPTHTDGSLQAGTIRDILSRAHGSSSFPEVKSRIEADDLNPRRLFHGGCANHQTLPLYLLTPSTPVGQLVTINLRPPSTDSLN
jgi:hypothetical protein